MPTPNPAAALGIDTGTAAGKIADRLIHRCFLIERLKVQLARRQSRRLQKLFVDQLVPLWAARGVNLPQSQGQAVTAASSARLKALYRRMDEEIDTAIRTMYGTLKADLVDVAKAESAAVLKTIEASLPQELAWSLTETSPVLKRAIITKRPFQGALLREHYNKLGADSKLGVRRAIQEGLTNGEGVPQIASRLRRVSKLKRNDAEAVAVTAVQHVTSRAREDAYRANSDLIAGERFTATLDLSTTVGCFELDGTVYEIGKGVAVPRHMRCRSLRIPVLRSWRELGFEFDQLTEGTRASMDGQVPGSVRGEAWLKADPARARAVLGGKRADLFLDGRLNLRQLLGPGLRPLTLDELELKFGLKAVSAAA